MWWEPRCTLSSFSFSGIHRLSVEVEERFRDVCRHRGDRSRSSISLLYFVLQLYLKPIFSLVINSNGSSYNWILFYIQFWCGCYFNLNFIRFLSFILFYSFLFTFVFVLLVTIRFRPNWYKNFKMRNPTYLNNLIPNMTLN